MPRYDLDFWRPSTEQRQCLALLKLVRRPASERNLVQSRATTVSRKGLQGLRAEVRDWLVLQRADSDIALRKAVERMMKKLGGWSKSSFSDSTLAAVELAPEALLEALRPHLQKLGLHDESAVREALRDAEVFERAGGRLAMPAPRAKNLFAPGSHLVYMDNRRTDIDYRFSGDASQYRRRFECGPLWQHNSCAFDVTAMLLLFMDAGLLQCDQLLPNVEVEMSKLARLWRAFTAFDWGALERPARQKRMGAAVLGLMAATDLLGTVDEYKLGSFATVQASLSPALRYLPQTELSLSKSKVCSEVRCGYAAPRKWRRCQELSLSRSHVDGARLAFRRNELDPELPEDSVEAMVASAFLYRDTFDSDPLTCTECGGRGGWVSLVNGDMPPRLVVFTTGSAHDNIWKQGRADFRPLPIDYYTIDANSVAQLCFAQYRLLAVISVVRGNHFILHVRLNGDVWGEYDGMRNGGDVMLVGERELVKRMSTRSSRAAEPVAVVLVWERTDCFGRADVP